MAKSNLQQQAVMLIERLPTEKLEAAIDFLSYLYNKEAWEATYELACDPEIVKSLERAEADEKAGRLKSWADVIVNSKNKYTLSTPGRCGFAVYSPKCDLHS